MRIGHGYDVHRLIEGRKLILGGVEINSDKGLLGHSDADVLVHSVIDAILGAAGLGDIGKMFPDDDSTYKDANSIGLLKKVYERIYKNGYRVINIDSTIIAQAPKLGPYLKEMSINISNACELAENRVNVKATTEENLGFTGENKGIASHSVCLLQETNIK